MEGLSLEDPTPKGNLELIIKASTVLTVLVEDSSIEDLLLSVEFKEEYAKIDEELALGRKRYQSIIDPEKIINTVNFMYKYNIKIDKSIEEYIVSNLFKLPTADDMTPLAIGKALASSKSYLFQKYYNQLGPNLVTYFQTNKDVMKFEDDCFLSKEWFEFLYLREYYEVVKRENPILLTLGAQYLHYLVVFGDTLVTQIVSKSKNSKGIENDKDVISRICIIFRYICNEIVEYNKENPQPEEHLKNISTIFTVNLCREGLFGLASPLSGINISLNCELIDKSVLIYYILKTKNRKILNSLSPNAKVVIATLRYIIINADTNSLILLKEYMINKFGRSEVREYLEKGFSEAFDDAQNQSLYHFIDACKTLKMEIFPVVETNNYSKFKEVSKKYPEVKIYHLFTPFCSACIDDESKFLSYGDFEEIMEDLDDQIYLNTYDVLAIIQNTSEIIDKCEGVYRYSQIMDMLLKYHITKDDIDNLYDMVKDDDEDSNGVLFVYKYSLYKGFSTKSIIFDYLVGQNVHCGDGEFIEVVRDELIENTPRGKLPLNIWSMIVSLPFHSEFFKDRNYSDHSNYQNITSSKDQRQKFMESLVEQGYSVSTLHLATMEANINREQGRYYETVNEVMQVYNFVKANAASVDLSLIKEYIVNDNVDNVKFVYESYGFYPSDRDIQLAKDNNSLNVELFFNKIKMYGTSLRHLVFDY